MSNEFVMVPRELADDLVRVLEVFFDDGACGPLENIRDLLSKAEGQHQGEPVGMLLIDEYFDNREVGDVDVQLDLKVCGQLAEKYPGQSLPLYTHADTGEVERLRNEHAEAVNVGMRYQERCEAMSAQLAERDALLDHMAYYLSPALASHQYSMTEETMHHALSVLHDWRQLRASAEPSAPKCREVARQIVWHDKAQFVMSQLLGTDVRCDPNKTYTFSLYDSDGAPVERDERAEFEKKLLQSYPNANLRRMDDGNYAGRLAYEGWNLWQFRAALERES